MSIDNEKIFGIDDVATLIQEFPVGICKFLLNDTFSILYGNKELYELFGCTKEQFQEIYENNITNLFIDSEKNMIIDQLMNAQNNHLSKFHVEHRLYKANKEIIWVLVEGMFTRHEDSLAAYGIVVDISEQKKTEEQLRINEKRFRMAFAQIDSTIFDYDIESKIMIHADKSAKKFGLSTITENVPDCLVESELVNPKSASAFLEMYQSIREGKPSASCIIQSRDTERGYLWQKITMTTIYDQDGKAVKAVGILEDIDEQTKREAQLIEKSERDSLTRLYNKGTTESCINKLLSVANPEGVLLIIDLDYFKNINDEFGHFFGDFVLTESAHRIESLFRSEDILGRIGGDEFFVYLNGSYQKETILKKANKICLAFKHPFVYKDISTVCTCSVGISFCPINGVTMDVLYQNADRALYQAKRNGRNQICCYSDDIQETIK